VVGGEGNSTDRLYSQIVKQHVGKQENKENLIEEPQIMNPKSNQSQLPQSLKKSFVQEQPSMMGN
jgi:hypothetical protein